MPATTATTTAAVPIATVNPATGELLRAFDPYDDAEVDRRVALAADAVSELTCATFELRGQWMRAAADLLDTDVDQLAATMTTEMGKTLAAARAEVRKCATAMRFYADHAAGFLADRPLADPGSVGASRAFVRYQPLGVVLAIMPWNFPVWQVVRFAAPALMAGNAGLLKHAPNVPQTALYLDTLFARAGFPAGAFQSLLIDVDQVPRILADPRVAAATLTGSERAGAAVAGTAGHELKKTVLELGGSDPFVVMPSADLDRAVQTAVTARVQNNGQSCIAAKRFVVHTDCYDAFTDRFVERMRALRMGDPTAAETDIGPLVSEAARDKVEAQVADAVAHGATVLCGGAVPDQPGWWYPPTAVAGVTRQMRIWREEVFGPVATLLRVGSAAEAVEVANATAFGLGSAAWTTDPAEQELFARELAAGAVFVNGMTTSYPQLPFGGIKRSGYGRELAAEGIREFCNTKTVWIG